MLACLLGCVCVFICVCVVVCVVVCVCVFVCLFVCVFVCWLVGWWWWCCCLFLLQPTTAKVTPNGHGCGAVFWQGTSLPGKQCPPALGGWRCWQPPCLLEGHRTRWRYTSSRGLHGRGSRPPPLGWSAQPGTCCTVRPGGGLGQRLASAH